MRYISRDSWDESGRKALYGKSITNTVICLAAQFLKAEVLQPENAYGTVNNYGEKSGGFIGGSVS